MADPPHIAFGRREIAQCLVHRDLCRDRVVRAQYAGDHGLRSRAAGPSAKSFGACADAALVPLCHCRRAGVRDSRNPAAQRIHLFQVLASHEHRRKNLMRFWRERGASSLWRPALNFIVDPLQLFRPARLFRRDVFDRHPHAGRRPDPEPAVRHRLHGHLACDSLPAERYRRRLGVRSLKLAMTGSNSHEQSFRAGGGACSGIRGG